MTKRWRNDRNDAGSLLASVFIMALGAGCCLFTVSAMSPESFVVAMCTVGSIVGVFTAFVVMQRFGKLPKIDMGFLVSSHQHRPDDGVADYEPRKAGEAQIVAAGTNRPISAEEAQELKITSPNTWVPARAALRRARQGDEAVVT